MSPRRWPGALGGLALATAALHPGSAPAQGVELFGEARLGIGHNIDNDGDATGDNDLRAVSQVIFGAGLTGETAGGIDFGAEIETDEAVGGQGGSVGQTEGSVFVSGAYGTLTYGDTDGADAAHVGDLDEVGLTCLGCENETPFISNGGGFGDDDLNFADDPDARPTIRYDYAHAGFGVSLSSDRDLRDVGVGASWTAEVGGGEMTIGAGYYDYAEFTAVSEGETVQVAAIGGTVVDVVAAGIDGIVPAGRQVSAMIGGTFEPFEAVAIYSNADSDGRAGFEILGFGLGASLYAWQFNAYYNGILDAYGSVLQFDGDDSYGVGLTYDLGGHALAKAGIVDTYAGDNVADFGISLGF